MRSEQPTHPLIDISTPDRQHTGLFATSAIGCDTRLTILLLQAKWIGSLAPHLMRQVETALREALSI